MEKKLYTHTTKRQYDIRRLCTLCNSQHC